MSNDHDSPAPGDPPQPDSAPDGAGPATGADAPVVPSRKRWIAAAIAALGVALFAVPFLGGPAGDPHTGSEAVDTSAASGSTCSGKGRANFDFTLKDVNGADVRMSDYKGKVVLLNFWATWCGPCKVEIPEFVEAYAKYRDKGFVILGVLSEDDPPEDELRAFMSGFKMNYPVLRQNDAFADAHGPLFALPTSFIIDRHGSICTKHMGAVSREMLEREIKGLL